MDKIRKLELIQRSLGIRHKLKVHESMKAPDTHEDLAIMLLSKWELEDELQAIEEILTDCRQAIVEAKKIVILKNGAKSAAAARGLTKSLEQTGITTSAFQEQSF